MNEVNYLEYPIDATKILAKKKRLKRLLLEENGTTLLEKNIAILGGSTTLEIRDILELFLLDSGIKPNFYESEYNKYYEDILFDNPELNAFKPDFIYFHTTNKNLKTTPIITFSSEEEQKLLLQTFESWRQIWDSAREKFGCVIIQNNFELPMTRLMGNLDASYHNSELMFINKLNQMMAEYSQTHHTFLINDIHYLSASMGLSNWYDGRFWHAYQYAMAHDAIPYLTYNIAAMIKAALGKSKKCLVLDLDNTLWGGVIGDDGVDGIALGSETPVADAYLSFQKYIKRLSSRGIILAICSKNEHENALLGLSHPDSQLKVEDFATIVANWEPKSENIKTIAKNLNIGLDSLVFVDDNPVEREIVRQQLPMVSVPDIGSDAIHYIDIVDKTLMFEAVSLSKDDMSRNSTYQENIKRLDEEEKFSNYDEFLKSLSMKATIAPFEAKYFDRITQLTNKTNQFNLTTKRYTQAEIEFITKSFDNIGIYGRLEDKFGDNGLTSIIIGNIDTDILYIDLWIMSCRILKRGMEYAMFNYIVLFCKKSKIKTIIGRYIPTDKNKIVKELYKILGFEEVENGIWKFSVNSSLSNKFYIDVNQGKR
jgi:FkbH-like protein